MATVQESATTPIIELDETPAITLETMEASAESLLDHARYLSIVGCWVWYVAPEKPSDAIRAKLKGLGFRWNKKRTTETGDSVWQCSCGFRTRSARNYDPRDKYGEKRIARDET